MLNRTQSEPVQLFYSYAHEDEALRETLEKHLSPLQRQGFLSSWHDRQILAGGEWAREIDEHLNTAAIILLLISPDFLASDYCYEIEMQRAMERHLRSEARVIPIILRPCGWQSAPFGALQALPRDGRPITTWENQDEAFLEVEQSLRALIEHQPAAYRSSRTSSTASQNREKLFSRLQTMYEDLLADSLQEVAWIDLGLSTQPEAVQNPANLFLRRPTQTAHPLPPGTSIRQVYQEANQELLLLGEPGAGKSTLLYQLGRDLLNETIQHPARPLPVLFPLSSWAEKRLPLQEWIAEQLASPHYHVPRDLSQQWVQQEHVLPLLDGLDEMEETSRPACIVAINEYRLEHPLCPLVVCSRSEEYATASTQERLHLQSAIEVQPLSPEQLETTLLQAGKPFAALRTELKKNTELRELARSPLWLNVLLLTFKNTSVRALPQRRSDLQQHLFQSYVQRMVEQKRGKKHYPLKDTTRWLSWLAKQMRRQNQTVFSVELLQPNWLPKQQRFKYNCGVGLSFGLIFGLISGLLFGLIGGLSLGLISGLLFGLIIGLSFGREEQITLAERLIWSWKGARSKLLRGLLDGLSLGFISAVVGRLLLGGLLSGLSVGLLVCLLTVLLGGLTPAQFTERHTISLGESIRRSRRNGLLVGLLVGLIVGLTSGLLSGLLVGLLSGLLVGLFFGLIVGQAAVVLRTFLLFWLERTDSFPFQAGTFLEDARARHLLQRVGGTYYRFVHGLLLDYFANLDGAATSASILAELPAPVTAREHEA